MNEFVLVFRRDYTTAEVQPTPEQYQEHLKQWQAWYGKLNAEDRLARAVQRIDPAGRISRRYNSVENGPYTEVKESIGGLLIIKASGYDEAAEIAKGCPILELGGNVEIRMAV